MTANLVKITESSTVIIEDPQTNTVIVKAAGPRGAQGDPGGSITVQDEGTDVGNISTYLNFVGNTVAATDVAGVITVTVSAAATGANSDITSLSGITGGISTPDYVQFDTGATVTAAQGRVWYNGGNAINVGMTSNVTAHLGEDNYYYVKATAAITKGQVCMYTGAVGASGVITAAPATGVTDGDVILGIAAESIALNGFGLIQFTGKVRNIRTDGGDYSEVWADGDKLYLNHSYAGGLTKTPPAAPDETVQVAAVVYATSGNSGTLQVRVTHYIDLDNLSNTTITSASSGDFLAYDGTKWINSSTLAIANGGTGATTAAAARENLLPDYTGNAGKLLAVNVGETDVEFIDAGGVGSVTSVAASVPTGFTISGSPITSAGTLAIGFDTGYELPTTTALTNAATAYSWGDHAAAGYLTSETYTGTVTSVNATVPTGLTVSGVPITSAGTLAIGLDTGYVIPTSTQITQGTTAYGWGDHASAGYLTSISSGDVTTALGYTPEDSADKGQANGYASLDGSGLVPASQLPSYVDDVLEYADLASFPATGTSGKIYVAIDTGKTYRWSGSAYTEISASPGTTDDVTEGSTNLYYTDARTRAAISVSGSLSYNSGTGVISYTQPTNVSAFTNDAGYLTTETYTGTVTSVALAVPTGLTISGSPITSSGTLTIGLDTGYIIPTSTQITEGTTAYSWGDHAAAGYLTSETYTGTVTSVALSAPTGFAVTGSPITASGTLALAFDTGYSLPLTASQTNWDTAYGWGDHASVGYLTSETYTGTVTSVAMSVPTGLAVAGTPITSAGTLTVTFAAGYSIPTDASQTNWDTAYGWGDHAAAGYLTSETYTGTVTSVGLSVPTGFAVTGSPITASGTLALAFDTGYALPTTASQTNWDTAYGWGDHSSAGYLTASSTIDGGTF